MFQFMMLKTAEQLCHTRLAQQQDLLNVLLLEH